MLIPKIISSFTGRKVRRVLGLGEGRRHRYTLNRAKLSDKENAQRREKTWWGDSPQWFTNGTPPRLHNQITPLIDGQAYFTALAQAIQEAEHYIFIIGWSFTPLIPINRHKPEAITQSRLLHLLSEAAQRLSVRILIWAGAPFLFQPDTKITKEVQQQIEKHQKETGSDVKCYLDNTSAFTHCHHQKAVVVDGKIAFVGGMDLTTFFGDRYDTSEHLLRAGINWHDVQLKIEGEAVTDVEQNFRQRWQEVAKEEDKELPHREPIFDHNWRLPVQIVRTIPHHTYKFAPRGEFGILHAYINLIAQAKRFIYLENQYLWSPHIMDALAATLKKERTEPFRVVLVLPAEAQDGKWDNDKHVAELQALDNGRKMVSVFSLYTSGPNMGLHPFTYRSVYVHAKVAIVDDEWLMVGSANLNNRGTITDGEMNALVHSSELACQTRLALWSEHLNLPIEEIAKVDPVTFIDKHWREAAATNKHLLDEKTGLLTSSVYPYNVGSMPAAWVLEEVQALTLEH